MTCDINQKFVSSFDRTIPAGATALVGRVESGYWRFFVESDQLVKVIIRQNSTLASFSDKQIFCAANSAIEFQGASSCKIFVLNESGNTANISTYDTDYLTGGLEPVEFAEDGLSTLPLAAWTELGSNNGFAQSFTNKCRIYTTAQFRIKAEDTSGNIVLLSGAQPVDEALVFQLDTPMNLRFYIRESVSSASGIKYEAIWLRE
tara:strand:- start:1092 stop:1703 length:612 start_codon:yes stop_codon:yes gene_type:complete